MKLPELKDLVKLGNIVKFQFYKDGELWYDVVEHDDWGGEYSLDFEFPVPIADTEGATFLAADKALLFMRYIRKHLEYLKKAVEETQ